MATPTISTTGNAAAIPNSAVAVVVNTNDADSIAIGAYYNAQRPGSLTCNVACAAGMPPLAYTDFNANVLAPVRAFLAAHSGIEYLAMTKGISAQTDSQAGGGGSLQCSTDSLLMGCLHSGQNAVASRVTVNNPYASGGELSTTRFSRSSLGFALVTRLDAGTRARALQLIDNATAARPWRAIQLLNPGNGGGYTPITSVYDVDFFLWSNALRLAGDKTTATVLRQVFETRYKELIGWYHYGVYSPGWSTAALAKMSFLPGGIIGLINSYSGFTLYGNGANDGGHVQPETLIPQGVTGAYCAVEEPYGDYPNAAAMFTAYRSGLTIAESFWKAIGAFGGIGCVIGDPICAPYHA